MATIKLPYLNPVFFTKINPDEIPAYVSRHMDEWAFHDTILPWEQVINWPQIWQNSDSVNLQFPSTYGPLTLKLYTCSGQLVATQAFSQVRQNEYDPTFFIYQISFSLGIYDPGNYYLTLEAGSGPLITFISEPFKLSEKIENSLLIEYFHREFKDDVFFETGFRPAIRVPAVIKLKQPTASDTDYTDEDYNIELLKSVAYEIMQLFIGVSDEIPAGVPPWMIKKLNRIMTLSNVKYDGRELVKNTEAALEEVAETDYPLSSWTIELRDKIIRSSVIYENESVVPGRFAVAIVADSKGFGGNGPGNDYFITDVE